jgi:hypothetical protein
MAAHRSQIGPDSFFLNTPDDLAERVFATEEFVLEAARRPATGREDDLFAGCPPTARSAARGSRTGRVPPPSTPRTAR